MSNNNYEREVLITGHYNRPNQVPIRSIRGVFERETPAPEIIGYKGIKAVLADDTIETCLASFEAKKIPMIRVESTQEDNPLKGFLNANFVRVLDLSEGSGLAIATDASEDWFIPLTDEGQPMSEEELTEVLAP